MSAHDSNWRSQQVAKILSDPDIDKSFLPLFRDVNSKIHERVESGHTWVTYSIIGMNKDLVDSLVKILENKKYSVTVDGDIIHLDWSDDPSLKDPVLQEAFRRMGVNMK